MSHFDTILSAVEPLLREVVSNENVITYRHAPSVTHVAICVSRAFRSKDQERERERERLLVI